MAKRKSKRAISAANSIGGKARAEQLASEQRIAIAKLGSQARNTNLTAKQRSAYASIAAKERWRKWRLTAAHRLGTLKQSVGCNEHPPTAAKPLE